MRYDSQSYVVAMEPDRVARLIQTELSRANLDQVEDCLVSAERLIENCMLTSQSAGDLRRFEMLLAEVRDRMRNRS